MALHHFIISMLTKDFDYELPGELIVSYPTNKRADSQLMIVDGFEVQHRRFREIAELIMPNDLLVLNQTKVIPARFITNKATGGRVEILVDKILSNKEMLAMVGSNKKIKLGCELFIDGKHCFTVTNKHSDRLFLIQILGENIELLMSKYGQLALPPYMKRAECPVDKERYQTVYASAPGSVAAPTAGLHFDQFLLDKLRNNIAKITLHVGSGTFLPVKTKDVSQHHMHAEYLHVSEQVCHKILTAKQQGGRIIAVGTTTVRALETAAQTGVIKPFTGDTSIFIKPGFKFNVVDVMVTNFHLPRSTLLMLVCAFAGIDQTLSAYNLAVANKYRFFSYGDAMFVHRNK